MELQQKLAEISAGAKKRIPADKLAIMHNAITELRASGIMDGVVKVGDRMPEFALRNTGGAEVSSTVLLRKGPLVVTFFRGKW